MKKKKAKSEGRPALTSAAAAQIVLEKELLNLKEQAAANPAATYTPETVNRAIAMMAWHQAQIREWESFVNVT
jgi:hypothetical protein